MSFATSVVDDAAAWIGLPLVFALTCLGIGLLAERAVRVRLPGALLLPVGLCTSVVLIMPGYALGAGGTVAAVLLVAATVAGLVLGRKGLRARLWAPPVVAAALAVLGLYLAPVVLSGGWTWAGYNFLNDTAVQMVLAERMQEAGATVMGGEPSTRSESIRTYLESDYPLGTHGHLGALAMLLGTGVDVAYQGYLAMLAMIAALALTQLARRAGLGLTAAAAVGALAVASNLFYQFAMQGSIKEVAAGAVLVVAATLGRELLTSERPLGMVVLVAIACAAMLSVVSSAAGPYIVVLAVALAVSAFLMPGAARLRARLVPAAGIGAVVVGAVALPTLVSALAWAKTASATLAPTATATSTLGQLARPLEAIQIAGVWLSGAYAAPIVSRPLDLLTHALSLLALALFAVGLVLGLRRREPAIALLGLPAIIAAIAVAPRASPYADAKLLAIGSPAVLFGAFCAALAFRGRLRVPGLVLAAVLAGGILLSDGFAYHSVRLAPVDRLRGLEDAAEHAPRDRGLVMLDELEEFGKVYGRSTQLNTAFEAITPKGARPFGGGYHLDLDQLDFDYVSEFQAIISRRGADVSRPPADFVRTYANRYYEVWQREEPFRVVSHLPIQGTNQRGGELACPQIRGLGRDAGPDAWLVAAPMPETVTLDPGTARDRPFSWGVPPAPLGVVSPATPGRVTGTERFEGGTYTAWVRGGTGRRMVASVDGKTIGAPTGINTTGQWLEAGQVTLRPGRHALELLRPGGDLRPGDGAPGLVGPLELVRQESSSLRWVRPGEADRLCGRAWDWIEVVER